MVEIAGRPMIDYQLEWLSIHGVEQVVVSCGHMAEVLSQYLADRTEPPHTTVVVESEPLGRGGGMRYAAGALADPHADFLALNGDVLTWFPLDAFAAFHQRRSAAATVALAPFRTSWGIVEVSDGDRIEGFTQSPVLPYWINAGVYILTPEVAARLPERGDHESTTFPDLAKEGALFGYRITGFWRGVDTVKDVEEASAQIALLPGSPRGLRDRPSV